MGTVLLAFSPRMNKSLQFPILLFTGCILLFCTNLSTSLLSAAATENQTVMMNPMQVNVAQSQGMEQVMAKYRVEIQELKTQVDFLNQQLSQCQAGGATATGGGRKGKAATTEVATDFIDDTPRSSYCSLFASPIPSALSLWNSNLGTIVEASKHELDKRFGLHDFTSSLLHLVSPDRLARSVVSLPHEWEPVKRVMQILYDRYLYLNKLPGAAASEPRKLKVLVMGGSLIVGVNCRKIVSDYVLGMQMPNRLCTWTHRLETLINKMLGGEFVEIHKIALGGTNTETGFVMWDSDFIPDETRDPDILINAYSTNDMHILTVLQAKEGNQTLRDKVMEMTQFFVRSVLKDGKCAPLLLHIDDYLGNEQREILTTTELSQAIQVLAHYYGFSSMSYANVVRDLVYADTKESWISPGGWYEGEEMVREIHPGMGMHIISSWVMGYNLLNLATTYCTIEPMLMNATVATHEQTRPYEANHGLPKLMGNKVIPGKPKGRPEGLPPPLVKSLSLENVTSLWKKAPPVRKVCHTSDTHPDDKARCPFVWFSGINKQGMNETYAHELFSTEHNPLLTENTGWDINSAGSKLGISPRQDREHPEFTLTVQDVSTPLSTLTVFYMKSYGDRWIDSRISVTVRIDGVEHRKDELVGIHDKQTSETYTHRIELPVSSTSTPSKYEVTMEHLGGVTFKIMGLAICK
jgi:hypothetical protein